MKENATRRWWRTKGVLAFSSILEAFKEFLDHHHHHQLILNNFQVFSRGGIFMSVLALYLKCMFFPCLIHAFL